MVSKASKQELTPESAAKDHLSLSAAERKRLIDRLRRVEGQVRGLQRMVDEGRYCGDILTQISAVQASLRGAAERVLQGHLRHCVTDAIRSGDAASAEATYRELTKLFAKYSR
jgi:DNA-binding FrmR family transcriptional regulator